MRGGAVAITSWPGTRDRLPEQTSVAAVSRSLVVGLVFGAVNAVVAIATLALVNAVTPDNFGWFAYAPLNEAVVRDPSFPWEYLAVPVALIVINVFAAPFLLRRSDSSD